MKTTKKLLASILSVLATASIFVACGKNGGPQFLEGILTEIEYGETVLFDEYIDYVKDSEYTIIVTREDGFELDVTDRPAWAPDAPGVYTITYTVKEGEFKGVNSFELTVVPFKIDAEYSLQAPTFVRGETMDFASYFAKMNIDVTSYYEWDTIMESVTFGDTTVTFAPTDTTYTFTHAGEHTFNFCIQTEDGQKIQLKETIIVYGWDGTAYAWMQENDMSGYKLDEVTAERKVVIGAGTHEGKASDFPYGGFTHDLGYFAYNGEYGVGDYIVVDFTGDNMPVFSFFRETVTASYYWYKYNPNNENKGIAVVNGFRMKDGSNATKFEGGVNTNMRMYGPYGIEHQDQANTGRMCLQGYVGNDEFGIEDLQQKYANVSLKMICGFSAATTTSVTFQTAVIRMDTMEVLKTSDITINVGEGCSIAEDYFMGSFVLYGAHGKTITLDKVYEIEEDTTMEELLDKFYGTPSEFKVGARTSVGQNEVLNVADYIQPAAGANYKLSWTDGTNIYPITGETFSFANSGTVQLIYNDGVNATVRLTISVVDPWLASKNISISNATITSERQVTFVAGSTGRGEAGKPANANGYLGYLAYNDEYGAGDYVVVDFTGNNMPMIKFFSQTVSDDCVNPDPTSKTHADQGVIFLNGYLDEAGTGGWKKDNLYMLSGHGITNIGLGDKSNNNAQYRMVAFDTSDNQYSMNALENRNTKYRMIVGFDSVDTVSGSLTASFAIINLDTGALEWQRTFAFGSLYNATDIAAYDWTGGIQIFGHYGKVITLDKVYEIEENTTLAALLTKYTPSVVE